METIFAGVFCSMQNLYWYKVYKGFEEFVLYKFYFKYKGIVFFVFCSFGPFVIHLGIKFKMLTTKWVKCHDSWNGA